MRLPRFWFRHAAAFCAAGCAFWFPISCGSTGNNPTVLSNMDVSITDQDLTLNLVFSSQFQLNTNAIIPIANNMTGVRYGEVALTTNPGGAGFTLALSVDRSQLPEIINENIGKTQLLPDGQPMSTYVNAPVYKISVPIQNGLGLTFYLGPTATNFYIGTALQFSFMSNNFPAQLVITQVITDAKNRPVAAASIFGPSMVGTTVKENGGLFIISNISNLIQYYGPGTTTSILTSTNTSVDTITAVAQNTDWIDALDQMNAAKIPLNPVNPMKVTGPNAAQYQDGKKLYQLLNQMNADSLKAYPK